MNPKLKSMIGVALLTSFLMTTAATGQPPQCDPAKIMTAEACAKCHANEIQVWQNTPHFQTFEELSRRPRSKEISKKMGLKSVKRSGLCLDCHYTSHEQSGKLRIVSGVSCESCHGAARDWINTHSDYGGPTATRQSESPQHREIRLATATSAGMRNTQNLYSIATSCLQCHTVPNEELVNVGGHHAGSDEFELVAWSQGRIRHNFIRGNGTNALASPNRLRVMYVVGMIADLEFSTRATAKATARSNYGVTVADRAARVAVKLFDIQQKINEPNVQRVLELFSEAELRVDNNQQLLQIADAIRDVGMKFATEQNGEGLAAVDAFLPPRSEYR